MPQIETAALVSATVSKPEAPVTLSDRIDIAIGFLRRRYRIILVGVLVCVPLGALYHYSTPATYTASAMMLVETQRGLLQESILGRTTNDTGLD